MDLLEKIKEDKWFALANCTLLGIIGYLIYDNRKRKNQLSNPTEPKF
jgi:hypothetical protein